jgi:hypothetical protein
MADAAAAFLLVTWLASGKPPSSYQIEFPTPHACEVARSNAIGQAAAINEWIADRRSFPPKARIQRSVAPSRM